jgi:hypothetical protein
MKPFRIQKICLIFSLSTGLFCQLLAFTAPLSLSPADQDALTLPGHPVQLHAGQEAVPKTILLRQLQPRHYEAYEVKTKAMEESLQAALTYLKSLNGEVPSLQRLSAYNADVSLNWMALEKKMLPEERAYHSYQMMKEAVNAIQSLTHSSLVTAQSFSGTLRQEKEQQRMLAAKQKTIESALHALETFDQMKNALDSDHP